MKDITIHFGAFGYVEGKGNETEKKTTFPFNEYFVSGSFLIVRAGAERKVYPLKVVTMFSIESED